MGTWCCMLACIHPEDKHHLPPLLTFFSGAESVINDPGWRFRDRNRSKAVPGRCCRQSSAVITQLL